MNKKQEEKRRKDKKDEVEEGGRCKSGERWYIEKVIVGEHEGKKGRKKKDNRKRNK